jgi:hypothetical protein
MNPLEIYKHLPRKNCGECAPKTCISFAVALGANPDYLEQCGCIEPEKRGVIRALIVQGDWRDGLIKALMDEVSGLELHEIAPHLGCEMSEGKLVVRCVGQDYAIGREGEISPATGNKWIKILLLHYVRNRGKGEFAGKWVSFSELKDGFVKASTFQLECEEPLRELMDKGLEEMASFLDRLGAEKAAGFPADHAWTMNLLPRIRTLILYRHGDGEFPSSLKMLFDAVTAEFIDVETLIFLCEGLVHALTNMGRS